MQSCLRLLKCPPSEQRNNGRRNDKVCISIYLSPVLQLRERALDKVALGWELDWRLGRETRQRDG